MVKEAEQQIINLDYEPSDLCSLPNAQLLVASQESNNLKLFDSNFNLIKTIDRIMDEQFTPISVATNGKNAIYIAEKSCNKIIKTDMDFNFIKNLGTTGAGNDELNDPSAIIYHENLLYVCDSENQRIKRLNEDLVFQESYALSFKPVKMSVIQDTMCVRPKNDFSFLAFYNLKPFSFKIKVSDRIGNICGLNSWFYEYKHSSNKLRCFDINGGLVDEKILKFFECNSVPCFEIIHYFNSRFLIGLTKEKMLIVL